MGVKARVNFTGNLAKVSNRSGDIAVGNYKGYECYGFVKRTNFEALIKDIINPKRKAPSFIEQLNKNAYAKAAYYGIQVHRDYGLDIMSILCKPQFYLHSIDTKECFKSQAQVRAYEVIKEYFPNIFGGCRRLPWCKDLRVFADCRPEEVYNKLRLVRNIKHFSDRTCSFVRKHPELGVIMLSSYTGNSLRVGDEVVLKTEDISRDFKHLTDPNLNWNDKYANTKDTKRHYSRLMHMSGRTRAYHNCLNKTQTNDVGSYSGNCKTLSQLLEANGYPDEVVQQVRSLS